MPSEPKHVFDYTIRIPGRCQPGVAWAPDSQNLFSFDSSSDTLVMHYTGFALAGSHSKAIAPVVGKRCCVAVNPDGRTLGWADESGMLHLEDLWAGHTEYQFPASSECLVFASDGRRFAYCPTPDSVGIAELHRSPILEAYRTNPNPMNRKHVEIQQLAVSPDGRWIATCDRFHLALWRCSDMKCIAANLINPEGTTSFPETTFENLHFSSDSRRVYVQETRAHRCVLDLVEQSDGLTYLAGLRRATIMTNDGMSTVPGMGNLAAESSVHDLVAASPNGQWQITTRTDENASVCNLWRNGSVTSKTAHLPEPAGAVWRTSVFSPDGRWWAVGARACEGTSVPGFVYSENTSEGNPRKVLSTAVCHSHLAVSSDGRWLLG